MLCVVSLWGILFPWDGRWFGFLEGGGEEGGGKMEGWFGRRNRTQEEGGGGGWHGGDSVLRFCLKPLVLM